MKKVVVKIINLLFGLFKIDDKKIIFQSGRGMVDGNPKAIFDYLKNNEFDYKLIWLVTKDTNTEKLDGVYYNAQSLLGLYHLATAKYWIRSESLGSIIRKREEQVYIQTWHGHGAVKKMGYDVGKQKITKPLEHTKEWDFLLTNDPLDEKIMISSTGYNKKILQIGTPLTDSIINNSKNEEFIKKLKKELKIPKNKKVVLYAPTFRDKQLNFDQVDLKVKELSKLKDSVILIRVHPLIKDKINTTKFGKNFINVCSYPDSSDLLAITDVLITDYSSIIYEFSILNRPIIFYVYDLEEYIKERGLYIQYPEDLPGEMVYTDKELVDVINKTKNKSSKKLKKFNETYNMHNTGNVCKKFVELLNNDYFKN